MTREIKFRAWDGKEMLDDWLVLKNTAGGGVFPVSLARKAEVVMQFTGLKDKNGKEIYEEDVVKWHNGEVGEILFHFPDGLNNIYGFVFRSLESWYGLNKIQIDGEIIGNIYENPELLK